MQISSRLKATCKPVLLMILCVASAVLLSTPAFAFLTTVTSCQKSPDGGCYAFVQVGVDNQNIQQTEEGIAKMFQSRGPGSYAQFTIWVRQSDGTCLPASYPQVPLITGQTYDTGKIYAAACKSQMFVWDGATPQSSSNTALAMVTHASPNPVCTGPQFP